MARKDLKVMKSLEELDKLLSDEQLATAKAVESNFKFEVSKAIVSIGEINQIASARITADSQVASAKIMADAEVISASLLAKAEIAVFQTQEPINQEGPVDKADPHTTDNMVEAIVTNANQEIRTSSNDAIEQIRKEASEAIERVKGHAKGAIEEIRTLVANVADRTRASAETAGKVLSEQREKPLNQDEMVENAKKAAEKLAFEAEKNLDDLKTVLDSTVEKITRQADLSVKEIMNITKSVEARILSRRDNAIERIDQILEKVKNPPN